MRLSNKQHATSDNKTLFPMVSLDPIFFIGLSLFSVFMALWMLKIRQEKHGFDRIAQFLGASKFGRSRDFSWSSLLEWYLIATFQGTEYRCNYAPPPRHRSHIPYFSVAVQATSGECFKLVNGTESRKLSKPEAREAVQALFLLGINEIKHDGKMIKATWCPPFKLDETSSSSRITDAVSHLKILAQHIGQD